MENIVSYAQTFHTTFEDAPLTEVDSLVLSQLAYLRYEGSGLGDRPGRALQLGSLAAEARTQGSMVNLSSKGQMAELMNAVATSPRYRWVEASHYVSNTDEAIDKQFAAITYRFEDGAVYIAFRGTDGTVTGWRENFRMTYQATVPSQEAAAAYLAQIAAAYPGPIHVGGHSKGGNLAVYAVARCPQPAQDRIVTVFSHDGPGFQKEFFDEPGYGRIQGRLRKTVPASAIIGMLLAHQEAYTIVDSTEHGIMQHRALSWVVRDGRFSTREEVNRSAQAITTAFNAWTDTLDMAQRQAIVDALFEIVRATNAQRVHTLLLEAIRNAPEVARAIAKIDPQTKQLLLDQLSQVEHLLNKRPE